MSYTDQYQEHLDHVAGCASEFQNCFTEAKDECYRQATVHSQRINKAKALGLHVVVRDVEYYCRATDAFAGSYDEFICAFPTRLSALERAEKLSDPDSEIRYSVI